MKVKNVFSKKKIVQTQVSENPLLELPKEFWNEFGNSEGLLLFGGFFLTILLKQFAGAKKSQLTTGRMAGTSEVINATKMSWLQMHSASFGKCEPSTLWIGTPKYRFGENLYGAIAQTILGQPPTLYLPDAGRGILAIGVPGSGKTFSVIDRAYESCYAQGMSGIIFDMKGEQLALHYPLAMMYGYGEAAGGKIGVIAPGKDYSDSYNALELMRDAEDSAMASVIGTVVMDNAGLTTDRGDSFFPLNGKALATGMVQVAKTSEKYADLALVYALFQLDNLIKRLEYNINREDSSKLSPWIATSFATFLSSKDAEKTVAGIKTQAQLTYSGFMQKDLLRSFIGKSTISPRLSGKQLIIFEMDEKRKSVIAPILSTMIHLTVVENLATKRDNPFFYGLDEATSLKFFALEYWINKFRSHGGVPIIGIQFLQQLYQAYGKEIGDAIAFALKTHILFDPGSTATAEIYSSRFGKKEVRVKTTTMSQSGTSVNKSISEQIHQVPLITADEITRFPRGTCVITSPGYGDGAEANFPRKLNIKIPIEDIERAKFCENLWKDKYINLLRERAEKRFEKLDPTEELKLRLIEAKNLLPLESEEAEARKKQEQKTGFIPDD